jgi:ribosomal protein S18 acetylase RimI-like enzyme
MTPSIKIEEIHAETCLSEKDMRAINGLLDQLSPATKHGFNRIDLASMLIKCATFLVARDTERANLVIGIITLMRIPKPTGWYAEIQDNVVDSAYHGQGIGKAITQRAIEVARNDLRVRYIELTSKPMRESANRLYVSLGFKLLAVANPDLGDQGGTNFYRLTL